MNKLAQRLGAARYEADEHYSLALRAYQAGQLDDARRHIESAIHLLPKHAEYSAMLGWIYLQDKSWPLANDAFEAALHLRPYEMLANYGRGMTAYSEKDWEAAAGYFLNALAAQPHRPEIHYYLALVRHRLGQNSQALQWMQNAQVAFANSSDQREEHCHAWIREFQNLLKDEMARARD